MPNIVNANNLSISNVTLSDRNPDQGTVVLTFDVSWENSWKTKINHDAVWLTVRLYDPTQTPTVKNLCQLSSSGRNPLGMSAGSASDLELYVPADKNGVFLRPSSYGTFDSMESEEVALSVDYTNCGFDENDVVNASVFGLEMVFVPEGAFYAGDNDASTAALDQGSSDSDPWYLSSESAVAVTNASSNGYRYVSNGNTGEDATGTGFVIPSSFPKGYGAFYAMKYEVTEGQWTEFVNAVSSGARSSRDVTDNLHKNTDTVSDRNTLSCSGSPLICVTDREARPASYLTWMDLCAFLDWAALRPMTELEFEKMARGPVLAVNGEFVWGTTNITAADTISDGAEDGTETVLTIDANANYNDTVFSGGDSSNGADYAQGPLRGGIFATASSTRETSGAAYYGVMDLSGNLKERVVTIGNSSGRNFEGTEGDGILSSLSGYEGNANQEDWPGIDAVATRGVTGADGSGFKGGSWKDSGSLRLRISDRYEAAYASTQALSDAGGRGVRTYDGE